MKWIVYTYVLSLGDGFNGPMYGKNEYAGCGPQVTTAIILENKEVHDLYNSYCNLIMDAGVYVTVFGKR